MAGVLQVPAGTSAGLKGVLLPTQAAAPAAGPPTFLGLRVP